MSFHLTPRFIRHSLSLTMGILFFALQSQAQQFSSGFSRDLLSPLEKKLNKSSDTHSNIQPAAIGLDTAFHALFDSVPFKKSPAQSLCIGSLASLSGGFQMKDKQQPLANGFVGLQLVCHLQNRWFANAGYSLVGGMPPNYIRDIADTMHYLPGTGYAVNDGNGLYHTHYTYGSLAYNQGKHFAFEIGKGKNFWGDGYRSMILSDNASSYPYAKITTKVWKLQYTNLWMQLRDISSGELRKDARVKYAAMHALSFNATKKFNISFYEMVIWQDRDTLSRRTLDINYLNPVIFYRPVEYSIGSPDNVILAMSMKLKLTEKIQFYGQFILDEFNLKQFRISPTWWANKIGGQFGVKLFNILPGFSWQSEGNIARPFTYTHGSPIQSYTHLNQSLAHPMGANFIEWVNFWRCDIRKTKITEQLTYAAFGRDRDMNGDGAVDNLGGNITRSYANPYGGNYGHEMLQGLKSTFIFHSLTLSHLVGKTNHYEVFITHSFRFEKNEFITKRDHFAMAGIRMTGLLSPMTDY